MDSSLRILKCALQVIKSLKGDSILNLCSRLYAVVPLPDFFELADFLEPISRKSGSVNTKIGKSVTPNFGNIKIGRVLVSI